MFPRKDLADVRRGTLWRVCRNGKVKANRFLGRLGLWTERITTTVRLPAGCQEWHLFQNRVFLSAREIGSRPLRMQESLICHGVYLHTCAVYYVTSRLQTILMQPNRYVDSLSADHFRNKNKVNIGHFRSCVSIRSSIPPGLDLRNSSPGSFYPV